ncbi:MAG: hypothetical protein HY287_15580 [Planctomycetes bacterium]|nr:hypothetical protein [Planctomycetota bacterium]MBI3835746.1 hypothetical protein [Planctomycetota bacterium]
MAKFVRGFAVMGMVGAMALRPPGADALVIHDHEGHDTHVHFVGQSYLRQWPSDHHHHYGAAHKSEKGTPNNPLASIAKSHQIVIPLVHYSSTIALLDRPMALVPLGLQSYFQVCSNAVPDFWAATCLAFDLAPPATANATASRMLVSILRSNHALLI